MELPCGYFITMRVDAHQRIREFHHDVLEHREIIREPVVEKSFGIADDNGDFVSVVHADDGPRVLRIDGRRKVLK